MQERIIEEDQSANELVIPVKFIQKKIAMTNIEQELITQLKVHRSQLQNNKNDLQTAKQSKALQNDNDSESIKECRICLEVQNLEQENYKLIKACKCTGSMSYAHEHCLMEWIKRKVQHNYKIKAKCEVCECEFNYRVSHNKIFDCEEFNKNYKKDKASFRCYFLFLAILLLGFLGLIVVLIIGSTDTQPGEAIRIAIMQSTSVKVIYIVSIFIYAIVLLVIILLFLAEFATRTELAIRDIYKYVEIRPFKNFKVYFRK